jgi:CheY-like chemotaxis protein
MLKKWGHTTTVAENGQEALAALARESFDLVLMDVEMPIMDGLAATHAIREQERGTNTHIPIVAMTAHALKGDRERCLVAGMDAYIAKPIQAETVLAVIQELAAIPDSMDAETKAVAESAAIGAEPVVNWDRALAQLGGDRELLKSLAAILLESLPELLSAIEGAIAQKNSEALRRAAHKLKSSIGPFSARDAYESAYRLETVGEQGNLVHAESAYDRLKQEISRLKRALTAIGEEDLS